MSEFVAGLNLPLMGIALAAGLLLGVLYLLGLWWTVQHVTRTGNRGLLIVSFVVRAALLLAGLWFLAGFGPQSLIAALTGFLLARWFMTRLIGTGGEADDAVT